MVIMMAMIMVTMMISCVLIILKDADQSQPYGHDLCMSRRIPVLNLMMTMTKKITETMTMIMIMNSRSAPGDCAREKQPFPWNRPRQTLRIMIIGVIIVIMMMMICFAVLQIIIIMMIIGKNPALSEPSHYFGQ